MEVKIETSAGFVKVAIVGRLVASSAEGLSEQLEKPLEKWSNILFDLSQMTHVDSSGLGILVSILQKCKAQGGTCRLAGLQPHPRVVFDITKVHRLFEIYDTVEEAARAFA